VDYSDGAMFFHLAQVESHGLLILILAAVLLTFWLTWRKGSWTRVIGSIATIPVGVIVTLLLGLFVLSDLSGCSGHGAPIYSPNGKNAALVWFDDEGATGGGASVQLYDMHGLRSESVFDGGWKSVDQSDVNWIDDSHVAIHYEHWQGYDEGKTCRDFHSVKVTCVPKQNGGAEAPPFTNY
jgi:hypothetical protein